MRTHVDNFVGLDNAISDQVPDKLFIGGTTRPPSHFGTYWYPSRQMPPDVGCSSLSALHLDGQWRLGDNCEG